MFVEAFYGYWTNSLGLISDAFHMLFDCAALAIGLWAAVIATWSPNQIFSYGYGRVEVLCGFINGVFLIFIALSVLLESAERFFTPEEISTDKLLLVSCMGLLVNLVGVFAFHDLHDHGDHDEHDAGGHSHSHSHSHGHNHKEKEKKKSFDPNIYGVYLHILADTLGSVGVIISSLLIQIFGWTTADPICSFCISVLIFLSVIPLLHGSATTLLQCTPINFDDKLNTCLAKISKIEGVVGYRNPHFWKFSKDKLVGTIQIKITNEASEQKILQEVAAVFKKKGVKDFTVEIVKGTPTPLLS